MPYITETYWVTTQTTANTPSWNAGARTIATFSNDGAFSFSVGQSIGIVCGLNTHNRSASYLEITHGFLIEDTRYRVIENGIYKTSWTHYNKSATFKIARRWGVVTYLLNDVLVYTSATSSAGTVFLDASLYAYDDTITTVTIEEYNDTPALLSGNLYSLDVVALDNLTTCWINGEFVSLTATGYSDDNRLSGSLSSLVGKASIGVVNLLAGETYSLTGIAETSSFIPEYNQIVGTLYALRVNGLQYDPDPGTLSASLSPLVAFGADQNITLLAGRLSPLTATIVIGKSNYLIASWADWSSTSSQGSSGETFGDYRFHEVIYDSISYSRLHEVHYGTQGRHIHQTSYITDTGTAQLLHEVYWLNTFYKLHESHYQSVVSSLDQTHFDQTQHEVSWHSLGGSELAHSFHTIAYQSFNLMLNWTQHEILWASLDEADSTFQWNEVSWTSPDQFVAFNLHETGWQTFGGSSSDLVFHTVMWGFSPSIRRQHDVQWKSIKAYERFHTTAWNSDNSIYRLHDTRYRSSHSTPILQDGLVYVRV